MPVRKRVSRAETKRALVQAGTPVFDAVVKSMGFDPITGERAPTPKSVAKRVSKKTATNPKVTA